MVGAVAHPPVHLTYAEYALLPDDGRRWELIEGDFHVNPAPVPLHQVVSRRLQFDLMVLLEKPGLAQVFNAPIDVILGSTTVVQPDLVVIAAAHRRLISDRGIEGPPDIVVEILSQNRAHDEVLKRGVYEKFGVPEYWIVDGRARAVEVLDLVDGRFRRRAYLKEGDALTSPQFNGRITIPLAPVFAEF